MAGEIIRPSALPDRPSPVASEKVPVDNGVTVGGATIEALVLAGRPTASQAEAEAGTDAAKAMTPLTTKQAIYALGDARFATTAQGALADSATQPGDLATVATTGDYDDLINKPTLSDETSAQSRAWAIANLHPVSAPAFIRTAGYAAAGDGGAALYKYVGAEPGHSGKFSITLEDGVTLAWYEIAETTLRPEMFGQTRTANDYNVFVAWASTTVALRRPWYIAPGTYLVDGAGELVLKTSGVCEGIIEIPKSNHTCRFAILRDDTGPAFNGGVVLSTAAWDSLTRGKIDISAFNAAGKNLYLFSTETLIERDGSGGSPYLKQEFIRVPGDNGRVSTGLVCTYTSLANLTVTSYDPSVPLTITGLHVRRTGVTSGTETFRGLIIVWRDSVTLNSPTISNDDPSDPISVGIEVAYCADVTINDPDIRGLNYAGYGYGIIFGQTIGCTINGGNILDCRHSITGRHNVDLHVYGGNHSYQMDDHWGDRMIIKDVSQTVLPGFGAIEYAGNDITIENHKQFGGRNLLGIRVDTPNLGGKVVIKNPKVDTRGEAGFFYLFGFTSPNGPSTSATWTTTPTLPDTVIMEDVEIQSSTSFSYCAHLGGTFNSAHTNWGDIILRGACRFNGLMFGIYLVKNSTYQQNRTTTLLVDGPMNFNGGQAIYADAADSTATRAVDARIVGIKNGDIRIRPYAVLTLNVDRSVIGRIDKDGAEAAGSSLFLIRNSRMIGGVVTATFKNMAFLGCTFTGNYSSFPAQADVTMDGNIRLGVTGLPANIRGAVVSPFA